MLKPLPRLRQIRKVTSYIALFRSRQLSVWIALDVQPLSFVFLG